MSDLNSTPLNLLVNVLDKDFFLGGGLEKKLFIPRLCCCFLLVLIPKGKKKFLITLEKGGIDLLVVHFKASNLQSN